MSEVWKEVPGSGGIYEVSDCGRVRRTETGHVLKHQIHRGYPRVSLYLQPCKASFHTVHSLVAAAFLGPRPPDAQVNHISGVKTENAAANLEYCTRSENMKHAHRIGLQSNRGERHSHPKLTDEKVRRIRALLTAGAKQSEVAAMMGIDQSAVSRANSGKRWGHVSNMMGCEQANNLFAAG